MKPNHLCCYSGLNIRLTPNQSHCVNLSTASSKVFAYFWVKSPAITPGFRRVVKGGFYRSFDLNLNIKKGNVVYFALTVFLFLESLAILDSYLSNHQEHAGKNIPKRHFLHANRIM